MTPSTEPMTRPWDRAAVFAATLGGIGRIGFAPGTFGAAVGLVLAIGTAAAAEWLGRRLFADWGGAALACEAGLVAAICLAGVPICSRAAAWLGRGKDPGAIVLDEAAAMAATLLVVPADARTPTVMAVAFTLFRVFDILTPFPCDRCERLPTGLGIMADDWAAAAYAAAILAAFRAAGWL
jgi:phosphatidylglycerophosphatase A